MKYSEKLKDPRWQKKRLEVLNRDEFTCQMCGDKETTLHVHHIVYRKNAEPWESDEMELVTICADCHEVEHLPLTELERFLYECMKERDKDEPTSFKKSLTRIIKRMKNG
jgi:5-methylcytosine-specific restriction endonuclease McrA